MDELLSDFLTETMESLEVIDNELVRFEREPGNAQILANVFRLVHTIKGTCGFLGLTRLETLAHAGETLMGRYRDGMVVTNEGVSAILKAIDRIKLILSQLEDEGAEPAGDDDELIAPLLALAGVLDEPAKKQKVPPRVQTKKPARKAAEASTNEPMADTASSVMVSAASAKPEEDTDLGVAETAGEAETDPDKAGSENASPPGGAIGTLGRPLKPGEVSLEELEAAFQAAEGPDEPALAMPAPSAKPGEETIRESAVASQTIRVNVQTIETLMTMVSELVLTRNQLLELSRRNTESAFSTPLQRLSNVTAELQEGVMKTRMQPIGNAWGKLPRIVRDLGQELGKPIDLEMVGADTELDRQVLELIRDPLTHMVRNSADHGIEPPDERRRAGKPERGKIKVAAYHEGGHIIISVSDDGRGLSVSRLRQKVAEKGLVSETELIGMSDAQIQKFIFNPGFSTAETVTSVSGRGVGMDVVRTNIELIGGSIDLKSVEGRGTTFTIRIPLTLAIIPALIVAAGGSRFAIPQLAVTELVRARADGAHRIERIKQSEVLRLRNALLPVVHLAALLGLHSETPHGSGKASFVIVAEAAGKRFGIVVDEVFHTEEIVVKPMSGLLKDVDMFSGNTIMGDGSVIMIVDPNGVARSLANEAPEDEPVEARAHVSQASGAGPISLLLFEAGSNDPKAVPLSLVTRLEEFSTQDIEQAGDRRMVQYRERLMPLVYVDPSGMARQDGRFPLLVFTEGERTMGLVVDKIIDIVEDRLSIEVPSKRPGFVGSAIIAGRATEILDVGHFLPLAFEDWFTRKEQVRSLRRKLLYAEDSPFFRNMLVPVLAGAGFEVTSVEDGSEAYELVQRGERYDIVVTDLEMPNMDGLALAAALRENAEMAVAPVIALSAFTGPTAEEHARQAGMFDLVAKFDRHQLLDALRRAETLTLLELAA